MNKKTKIVLLVLILILLVLIIRSTYSKYTSESDAIIKRNIAQWVIKVNDTDITVASPNNNSNTTSDNTTSEKSVTFEITGNDVVWNENSNVVDGKVAPGMKGYFYLRIDPEKTQTALMYTINVDISNILKEHINFKIKSVSEENKKSLNISEISENGSTLVKAVKIQRIKELAEIQSKAETDRIDTIKVEIEWVDDGNSDNFDTKVGQIVDKKLTIPVTVNVIQYIGQKKL